jgi:speckle-type POZ protein
MFTNKMLESSMNTVEIQDFDSDIVEEMLNYMYTGEVKSLADKAPKLFQIAEKYDIPGLKKKCEYSLADNLTVENAADVLIVAHFHNAEALKAKVISFINRFVQIVFFLIICVS